MLDQGVFENIGAVTWDTTVKTSGFTAVSGNGYFCNTTSAAFTVTLPSSPSAGDIVGIKDYANTADTNNITIGRNGSNIQGTASDFKISTEGRSVLLVYVDGTKGWLVTSASQANDISNQQFVTATGGTILTCGDYKTHVFTGPGTFTVTCAGNPLGSTSVDYMVVAGGGGGRDGYVGGAGGAGGFRLSNGYSLPSPTTSPLANPVGITVSATGYPITVGGGGPATSNGSNSVFSTITSTGGGLGANGAVAGSPGGSGGGGGASGGGPQPGGSGNTPPVSPPQGNNGGAMYYAPVNERAGGGGGAGGVGADGTSGPTGAGGVGSYLDDTFFGPTAPSYGTPGPVGSTKYFAGGGSGGGSYGVSAPQVPPGGAGGGGRGGAPGLTATPGTTNTGGGGGGGGAPGGGAGGIGGSGIVMIRYKFQ
jgi:hypothetical protein